MQQLLSTDISFSLQDRQRSLFSPAALSDDQQQRQQAASAFGWSHFGLWDSNSGSDASSCTTPDKADSGVSLSPYAPAFNYPTEHQRQQQQQQQAELDAAALSPELPGSVSFAALQQQQQQLTVGCGRPQKPKQAKPGIGHEIDRWIASVTCSAPIAGPGLSPQGPNNIVLDKNTLLSFLSKLKMYHQKKREMKIELCVFCRQNQEPFQMYTSHRLTDALGNVTCPVLFQYVCPICSATGSKAHTIKYCPLGNGLLSGEACLRTARNAVGQIRKA